MRSPCIAPPPQPVANAAASTLSSMSRTLITAALCLACIGAAAPTDAPRTGPSGTTAPSAAEPAAPALFGRVALLGASATAGFNVNVDVEVDGMHYAMPVDLGDVLRCASPEGASPASEAASFLFFTNPGPMGSMFAQRTLEAKPTLVIAVDYLFWFGYGLVEGDELPARLALLDQGLANLDRLPSPIIVGDFPDMSEAVGQMLVKQQVPSPEALRALNDRLRAWVAERPRVRIFGLAEFVDSVRKRQPIRIGENVWTADRVESLLQPDKLHPTLDGLVAIALQTRAIADGMQLDGAKGSGSSTSRGAPEGTSNGSSQGASSGAPANDPTADPVGVRPEGNTDRRGSAAPCRDAAQIKACVEAAATAKARERQARRSQPGDARTTK